MKYAEFAEKVNQIWTEKFNGKCVVKLYKCFGQSITIDCRMSEKINVTRMNDMLDACLNIDLPDSYTEADELPETMTVKAWKNWYRIKPESQYLCFDSRKIPFRKSTGTPEKMIEVIGKFIDKIHSMIAEDMEAGNIHKDHVQIVAENLK